jgi:hypothetical protein
VAQVIICNYEQHTSPDVILLQAFRCDLPLFEKRCSLSPDTVCAHPENCRKAEISLRGYYHYQNHIYTFRPLPSPPTPIFEYVCSGCAQPVGRCREQCSTYAQELTSYTVYEWSLNQRDFIEKVIHKDLLSPRYHGYFSYKHWRDTQAGAKRKHRDWEKEQANKRRKTTPAQRVRTSSPLIEEL